MDLGGQIPPADRVLFGSKLPYNRANFGGRPRTNSHIVHTDSVDAGSWRVLASLSDVANFRSPVSSKRIPRITVAEQLPQIMIIVIIIVTLLGGAITPYLGLLASSPI